MKLTGADGIFADYGTSSDAAVTGCASTAPPIDALGFEWARLADPLQMGLQCRQPGE
jgi:hypothetical protein